MDTNMDVDMDIDIDVDVDPEIAALEAEATRIVKIPHFSPLTDSLAFPKFIIY